MKAESFAAVGLVVRRPPRQLAAEPYYPELVGGLDEVLNQHGLQMMMSIVDEMSSELDTYRRWAADGSVRAVAILDLVPNDPRPELVNELALPAVIVGEPEPTVTTTAIRTDNYAAMRDAVAQLIALGHRRLGHVTGISTLVHTRERARAFADATAEYGLGAHAEAGDYSTESGERATERLLGLSTVPSAVIYDNDLMAIGGLSVARRLNIQVPSELSLVAWDDSPLCRMASPQLSAMSHDVHALGELAARTLLEVLDGRSTDSVVAEAPVFVSRGSTTAYKSFGSRSDIRVR